MLNRRQALQITGSAAVGLLALPQEAKAKQTPKKPKQKEYDWFTHQQLQRIYEAVRARHPHVVPVNASFKTSELVPKDDYETFHLALMRMSNIIHRKTLAYQEMWIVLPPSLMDEGLFFPHAIGDYENGKWVKKKWTKTAKRVTPHVYLVGHICHKWKIYVNTRFKSFHRDVLVGSGGKQAQHMSYIKPEDVVNPTEVEREYGRMVATMGPPTLKNYALIRVQS